MRLCTPQIPGHRHLCIHTKRIIRVVKRYDAKQVQQGAEDRKFIAISR
jgi:hypothetical protein